MYKLKNGINKIKQFLKNTMNLHIKIIIISNVLIIFKNKEK